MALEMIFITTLGKPVEGSPWNVLTEQASSCGNSRTSEAGYPHCLALSGLVVEVQKVLGGKASSQQYGQNERKSPVLPLLARHTAYVIPFYLPKVAGPILFTGLYSCLIGEPGGINNAFSFPAFLPRRTRVRHDIFFPSCNGFHRVR